MATTQYQVFCRYLNENVNHVLANKSEKEWISKEVYENMTIEEKANVEVLVEKEKAVTEICIIRPEIKTGATSTDLAEASKYDNELYQLIVDQAKASNPKYDMIFLYDGVTSYTGEKGPNAGDNEPVVLYERMKRIKSDPWFLYSTHASLTSAMNKAKELVNIFGKTGVKVGKVVPLEQYIEIV